MCTGRCGPCGKTGPLKVILKHQVSCDAYAQQYQSGRNPLGPVEEYERWVAEDKASEREQRVATAVADTDARRAAMTSRFRTHDILED